MILQWEAEFNKICWRSSPLMVGSAHSANKQMRAKCRRVIWKLLDSFLLNYKSMNSKQYTHKHIENFVALIDQLAQCAPAKIIRKKKQLKTQLSEVIKNTHHKKSLNKFIDFFAFLLFTYAILWFSTFISIFKSQHLL